MLQFLLGSITRVYCEEGGGKARHNETLAVTASFKSGAVGTLLLTECAETSKVCLYPEADGLTAPRTIRPAGR